VAQTQVACPDEKAEVMQPLRACAFKQIVEAGGSGAALIQVLQLEQREIVHSLGVMLARSRNVDDCPGHNLGYRIVTIEQLKGFANGLKRGGHGFDRLRLKNGSLQVGGQRHSIFKSDWTCAKAASSLGPRRKELMPDKWAGVGNQGYQRTQNRLA
jgi:hypothetical protein